MADVISIRQAEERDRDREFAAVIAEAVTKTIGGFLGGVAQDAKAGKRIAAAAGRVNFRKMLKIDKKKELPSVRQVMQAFNIGTNGLGGKR